MVRNNIARPLRFELRLLVLETNVLPLNTKDACLLIGSESN